ncbi:hypothetical protein ACL2XP_07375 [Sodalis sp. RH21]|uniref:hypothetical protein n=1 Tax=unclassified Sodalis (in: enterobacteria) TaxID=2636512 RepID=UPI0039B46F12
MNKLYCLVIVIISFSSFADENYSQNKPKLNDSNIEMRKTYGNFNSAAGQALLVNDSSAKAEISGFRNDSAMSAYTNKDHVGYYISMHGPTDQLKTQAINTKYTSDGLYSPNIKPNANIAVGMFITTAHSPPFSARITSLDFQKKYIGVSGWYQVGNEKKGQVPENGYSAIINAADKIWGQNTNIYIDKTSSAKTATGYELGILADGSQAKPVWGFHAVNLRSANRPFDQAFRATGAWVNGYFASNQITNSFIADEPRNSALLVKNTRDAKWNGTVVTLDSNNDNSNSFLLKSNIGNKNIFYIKSNGTRSSQREEVLNITESTTLDINGPSVIICNNVTPIKITLPDISKHDGIIYEIKSAEENNISVNGQGTTYSLDVKKGTYIKLISSKGKWIKLFQSN